MRCFFLQLTSEEQFLLGHVFFVRQFHSVQLFSKPTSRPKTGEGGKKKKKIKERSRGTDKKKKKTLPTLPVPTVMQTCSVTSRRWKRGVRKRCPVLLHPLPCSPGSGFGNGMKAPVRPPGGGSWGWGRDG